MQRYGFYVQARQIKLDVRTQSLKLEWRIKMYISILHPNTVLVQHVGMSRFYETDQRLSTSHPPRSLIHLYYVTLLYLVLMCVSVQ